MSATTQSSSTIAPSNPRRLVDFVLRAPICFNLSIHYFYFLEVLFQCLVVFIVVMAIRPVREYAKEQPWRAGVSLFMAAVAAHFIGLQVADLAPLDYRVPQFYLYLVIYGWCLHFAKSAGRKNLALMLALVIFPTTFVAPSETFWLVVGSMLLLFVPKVSISGTARRMVDHRRSNLLHLHGTWCASCSAENAQSCFKSDRADLSVAPFVGFLGCSLGERYPPGRQARGDAAERGR